MARPPTGQIIERRGARGTSYGLRFRAYGQRHYVTAEATTRQQAEVDLQNILADVRRGIWRPPVSEQPETPKAEPTFHEFASEWLAARELEGLADKTITDLRWSLVNHLLPHFADYHLSEITPQEIDRYKVAKVREREAIEAARAKGEKIRERGLSNNSINHTLSDLSQVLETAVEYDLIGSNPASGKRRRLKSTRPSLPWVEPEQLPGLLDAASGTGRVLLALLAGAGLRIGEALALRWQHVDLATGTLHVVDSKTAAGVRSVDLTPALREQLVLWRAESDSTEPEAFVIATSTGAKHNPLEPAARRPAAGHRDREREASEGRHRADRAGDVPLAAPNLCLAPLRRRRRRPLHQLADRAHGRALQLDRLRAGDEPPRAAVRAASEGLRSSDRMGTNGHQRGIQRGGDS